MPSTDVFALKRSRLNEFIYSGVGVEPNGVMLSLVSVFARRGTDPWQEAGRLAVLPRPDAIESLALSIAGMPSGLWSLAAATTIATRLVELLPAIPGAVGTTTIPEAARSTGLLKIGLAAVIVAIGLVYALGMVELRVTPHQADGSSLSVHQESR